MKRKIILILSFAFFALQYSFSQDSWTFYSSSSYKGNYKEYTKGVSGLSGLDLGSGRLKNSHSPGVMEVNNQWNWSSWKTDRCIRLYYYTKYGKVAHKDLCGDVRDFKYELKKWRDLKYGYDQGWKNIQKIVLYNNDEKYAGKKNGYKYQSGNKNNNYPKPDYHKGKENFDGKTDYKTQSWYSYYGKGNVIFVESYNYKGKYKAQATGSQDHRSLKFYPRSIIVSRSGRYVVVEYRDQYNTQKSFVVKEDIPDLKKYMTSNLKLGSEYYKEPYKAITKFTIMRN